MEEGVAVDMEEVMTKNTIIKAVTAARIFIKCEKELTLDDYENLEIRRLGSVRTGALRRASMELTRRLTEMRR